MPSAWRRRLWRASAGHERVAPEETVEILRSQLAYLAHVAEAELT